MAWEGEDRRAYQFEDGNLRLFKQGYYDFLQPVKDTDEVDVDAVEDELYLQLALTEAQRQVTWDAMVSGEEIITLDDQLTLFLYQYPEGFVGEAWTEAHRARESGRSLKRHRDATIEMAQELTEEALTEAIESRRYADLVRSVVEIWRSTDLVAVKEIKIFEAGSKRLNGDFLRALHALLYGTEPYEERMTAYMKVLSEILSQPPSWQLVTSLPALVNPKRHVCVRPSVFKQQVKTVSPKTKIDSVPDPAVYMELQQMCKALRGFLGANDLQPRDLLDVHDFLRATLSRKSRELLPEATQASRQGDSH